jgi:hypothetical protein
MIAIARSTRGRRARRFVARALARTSVVSQMVALTPCSYQLGHNLEMIMLTPGNHMSILFLQSYMLYKHIESSLLLICYFSKVKAV